MNSEQQNEHPPAWYLLMVAPIVAVADAGTWIKKHIIERKRTTTTASSRDGASQRAWIPTTGEALALTHEVLEESRPHRPTVDAAHLADEWGMSGVHVNLGCGFVADKEPHQWVFAGPEAPIFFAGNQQAQHEFVEFVHQAAVIADTYTPGGAPRSHEAGILHIGGNLSAVRVWNDLACLAQLSQSLESSNRERGISLRPRTVVLLENLKNILDAVQIAAQNGDRITAHVPDVAEAELVIDRLIAIRDPRLITVITNGRAVERYGVHFEGAGIDPKIPDHQFVFTAEGGQRVPCWIPAVM